jgi:hypothetical protein
MPISAYVKRGKIRRLRKFRLRSTTAVVRGGHASWRFGLVAPLLVSCSSADGSSTGSTAPLESIAIAAPLATTTSAVPVKSSVVEVGAQASAVVPNVTHLAWLPVLYPIFQFLPDGALLAAEPNTGRVVIVASDGSIRFDGTLPTMQTLAAGPHDVVYAAELNTAGGTTLVAYATTGTQAGTAVGRWETSWACRTGPCSDFRLGQTGIATGPNSADTVAYVDESGRPSGTTWTELDEPVVVTDRQPGDGVQAMSTTDSVTFGDQTWSVHASNISSVVPLTYTPHRDGTVTAVFTGSGHNQFERLVWLRRGGDATQFNTDGLRVAAFPNEIIDGGVLAIRFQDDAAELIRLDLPNVASPTPAPTSSTGTVSTSTAESRPTPTVSAGGLLRPFIDPNLCAPLAVTGDGDSTGSTFDLHLFAWPTKASSFPIQIIGDANGGPTAPFALLQRYPDQGDLSQGQAVTINDWEVSLNVYSNGNGDGRWGLPDGGMGYLRSRGLDRDSLVAIISSLTAREANAAIPGFDYSPGPIVPATLQLLVEHLNTGVYGRAAGLRCQVATTNFIYRISALDGDPVFQYAAVIDGPVPLEVGYQQGTLIIIGGLEDPTAPSVADVVNADPATWNNLPAAPAL